MQFTVVSRFVYPLFSYAWSDVELHPSHASRPGQPSSANPIISLNAQTIDLTLSDAIYLGLRDNRSIRSIYFDRISQKFNLRVAEDCFTPKLVLSASYQSDKNQDDRSHQGNMSPVATLLTPYEYSPTLISAVTNVTGKNIRAEIEPSRPQRQHPSGRLAGFLVPANRLARSAPRVKINVKVSIDCEKHRLWCG
uniref:hypothetical protein n=2 Tax=Lonsdalea quercina TaxID=71657 RepID=UPI0039753324